MLRVGPGKTTVTISVDQCFIGCVAREATQEEPLDDSVRFALLRWIPGFAGLYTYASFSENELFVYTRTPAPWPVKDRDTITRMRFKQQPDGSVLVNLEGTPDYVPVNSSCVRIPHLKGFWQLTAIDEHTTQIIQQIHASPGGSIPAWLANSSVVARSVRPRTVCLKEARSKR